jgi:hypothetical protein
MKFGEVVMNGMEQIQREILDHFSNDDDEKNNLLKNFDEIGISVDSYKGKIGYILNFIKK